MSWEAITIIALLAIIATTLVGIYVRLDALDTTIRKAAFVTRGDWQDFRAKSHL